MIDKFSAEYIAGGAAQNTARVTQVHTFVCKVIVIKTYSFDL